MNTEELIKESNAEATAGIEKAAKNVESLLDTIRNLRADVAQLKDANSGLRSQILEFKNWSDDRLSQISVVPQEEPIKGEHRYDRMDKR